MRWKTTAMAKKRHRLICNAILESIEACQSRYYTLYAGAVMVDLDFAEGEDWKASGEVRRRNQVTASLLALKWKSGESVRSDTPLSAESKERSNQYYKNEERIKEVEDEAEVEVEIFQDSFLKRLVLFANFSRARVIGGNFSLISPLTRHKRSGETFFSFLSHVDNRKLFIRSASEIDPIYS